MKFMSTLRRWKSCRFMYRLSQLSLLYWGFSTLVREDGLHFIVAVSMMRSLIIVEMRIDGWIVTESCPIN